MGTEVKLSDGEKLIVVMLSDIYKALKIEGGIDPEFVASAVAGGHAWALRWEHPGLFEIEEDDPSVVQETSEILNMWWVIERSYNALSPADRRRVEVEASPFGKNVKFTGFDGNHEPHFRVAVFLVEKMGRYDVFKGRTLNSHSSTVDGARRMLDVFNPILRSLADRDMTADEIMRC